MVLLKKLFYLIFLLCYFVASHLHARPIPITIPADIPRDDPFEIKLRNSFTACVYANKFSANGGTIYPMIDYWGASVCKRSFSQWRYDVLNRISTFKKVDEAGFQHLCLTENTYFLKDPNGGGRWVFKSPKTNWDYLTLKPCTTNDPRQQWRYVQEEKKENDHLINVGSSHKIGENLWTLATAVDPIKSYIYTFQIPRGQKWLDKKAEPKSFEITVKLAWEYDDKLYSIFGSSNGSLRYSPSSKQISYSSGTALYCLKSNLDDGSPSTRWAWATWVQCGDEYQSGTIPQKQQWTLNSIPTHALKKCSRGNSIATKFHVTVTDYQGNILRIKQAGEHWGEPYVYRSAWIAEDTSTASYYATSIFVAEGAISDWYNLAAGNKLRSLQYCPAPGLQPKSKQIRDLPVGFQNLLDPSFVLTDEWIRRLHQVVTTVYNPVAFGICGDCMMHAVEMLLNFARFGNQAPLLTQPGLLYDPDSQISPATQFMANNPLLSGRINSNHATIMSLARGFDVFGGNIHSVDRERFFSYMLSHNSFTPLTSSARIVTLQDPELSVRPPSSREPWEGFPASAISPSDMEPAMEELLAAPINTAWFVAYFLQHYTIGEDLNLIPGERTGHTLLLIRHADGIGMLNTNLGSSFSLDSYRRDVNQRYTDTTALFTRMREGVGQQAMIYTLDMFRIVRPESGSMYDQMISHQGCDNSTEGGAGGYGSGEYLPVPRRLNQCGDGSRCVNAVFPNSQPQ